jgi:hypothetical protein
MAYVEAKAPGFRYGLGTMAADAVAGQCVRLTNENVFSVNDDAGKRSFGILAAACKKDELAGVFCMGGIYETDQYSGNIAGGEALSCDAQSGKLKTASGQEFVVAEAISVVAGVLRFKLLV